MKAVIVGYGEVGGGLWLVFYNKHSIVIHDPDQGESYNVLSGDYDLMLVAIPYSDNFINTVLHYSEKFRCKAIIVFSTVPIGTCKKIGAIHSPIEGRHTNMAESIRLHTRWVGGGTFAQRKLFADFCLEAGIERIHRIHNSDVTEFLKLQSLAIYGINIEWARYCGKVVDRMGEGFEAVEDYNDDYNDLVEKTGNGQERYHRCNPFPPEGMIGGHCVIQNMKFLNGKHPFIDIVLGINGGWRKEVGR